MARDDEAIRPMTLGSTRRHGVRGLFLTCQHCGHERAVNMDDWPDDATVPSWDRACAVANAVSWARRLFPIGSSGPTDCPAVPGDDVVEPYPAGLNLHSARPILLNIEHENRDVAAAFATIVEQHAEAILVGSGAVVLRPVRGQIVSLAARHGIATMFFDSASTVAGALSSYDPDSCRCVVSSRPICRSHIDG